jgi:predicted SAM-dependent methyltransferase
MGSDEARTVSLANAMRSLAKAIPSRLLSRSEHAALDRFFTELQISRYHRRGLRRMQEDGLNRPKRLHLGCGSIQRKGYLNVDLFPGGDLTLDLRRGLPFESACCEMILSEHFFEHIDYPEPVTSLLRDCFRVLKPDGKIRISVPDTEWPILDYPKGDNSDYYRACLEHNWHPTDCKTRIEHINYHFRQNGEHLFAYDEETMRLVLEGVGFREVQRASFDPQYDSKHREVGSLVVSAAR